MKDCLCFYHRHYRVSLRISSSGGFILYVAIVRCRSYAKVQNVILQSGFAPIDAKIDLAVRSDSKNAFVPLQTLNEFRENLVDLRQRLKGYEEMLKLNTFDPELWRQQLIENSRTKDLSHFRIKIHSSIRERYGLLL